MTVLVLTRLARAMLFSTRTSCESPALQVVGREAPLHQDRWAWGTQMDWA